MGKYYLYCLGHQSDLSSGPDGITISISQGYLKRQSKQNLLMTFLRRYEKKNFPTVHIHYYEKAKKFKARMGVEY